MKQFDAPAARGFLYTDQYQLSMAQLYFKTGLHEKPAQFDHFFRKYPDYGSHKAGYCVNAGLAWLLDWMEETRCNDEDIEFLRGQTGRGGKRIFHDDFLDWLRRNGDFGGISIRAIPEGRVVHANTPLTVIRGPLALAQILETPLLNQLNFQTLIATKAARIRESCRGQMVLEFGMRRAHGLGANAGARAAMIGGADFTSNVGISHVLGTSPKGTHAHSMVQAFMGLGGCELDAFRAYADVYPDDCLLLVDTINTLESGIPNAIKVFEELRKKGHEPVGVRLDSGDLAHLSIQAAKMLNEAGFEDAKIVLSNQLDELTILQIVTQIREEASGYGVDPAKLIERLVYGVGTRLITSQGYSALDGVYKLAAIYDGEWKPAIKLSETPDKTINPGDKNVWRIYDLRNRATADLIALRAENPGELNPLVLRHPSEHSKFRVLRENEVTETEPLLADVARDGRALGGHPSLGEIRERREADIGRLDMGVRRILNPHIYHVSLSQKLWDLKRDLIQSANGN